MDRFIDQKVYSGYDSYLKLEEILKEGGFHNPLLICDKIFNKFFLKDYLDKLDISVTYFSDFSVIPQYEEVLEAKRIYLKEKSDVIISVGGARVTNIAKALKMLLEYEDISISDDTFLSQYTHICFPTTAGPGNESTSFTEFFFNKKKIVLKNISLIPEYVILEPSFLITLPAYQKKSSIFESLTQSIESCISSVSTTESIQYALDSIRGVLDNIDGFLNNDRESFIKMMVYSNYSGKAYDIADINVLTDLSQKMHEKYEITRGHAKILCFFEFFEILIEKTNKYDEILLRVANVMGCENFRDALHLLRGIYESLDIIEIKPSNEDVELMVNSVSVKDWKNIYFILNIEDIKMIYRKIFGFFVN